MRSALRLLSVAAPPTALLLLASSLPISPAQAAPATASAPAAIADARFDLTNLISSLLAADDTKYVPATTKVCVLPVQSETGEKAEDRRKQEAERGYQNVVEQFTTHGFKVVDSAVVDKAITDAKVNLGDEEDWKRDSFYKVAKAADADLVVFVVVLESAEDTKKKGMIGGKEIQGRAKVKLWLLDAKQEKPIYSAVVREGKAGGASKLFATGEGRDRRANAVANAIKEQLEEFFTPYPVVTAPAPDQAAAKPEPAAEKP